MAQVAWIYQFLWRRECSPSLSVISAAFIAFGRSWGKEEESFSPLLTEKKLFWSSALQPKLRALGASLCEKLSGSLPCSSYFPYIDRSPKGLTPQSKAHITEYFSSENRSEAADICIKSSTPSAINYNCVQFKGCFIHFPLWKHFLQLYLWFKLNFYHKIVLASVLFLFIVPLSCS